MPTTVTIDDALFAKALGLAPPGIEKSELMRECIKAFIQQQAAKRLTALGGQLPEIDLAPRQRQAPAPY
ncbi:MAG: type II toxin-antitoxin system VapB family antitoxin [Giesbergeria sp.]|uniref:type II toxin-antitoxin system VapB family antitoxin n=1 Tax=Giesbergeria sp. TaxID=2818473 RepID=UPI002635DBC6|nr:type II toxin-antitoxin system VapB family antitoxin [Giesbergeria sp.]MDD2609980.1 type II toxin-antitoxin system VapB family antitoxin [Giesbergeria sp.]